MIKTGDGYELILGSSLDPQFGPVLLFGTGGQLVEVFKDRALAPAAAEHHAGAPHDGADQDLQGAARACAAASPSTWRRWNSCWCASASWWSSSRWIKEIDINPLLASPERLVALDARVVVHGPEVDRGGAAASSPSGPIPTSTSAPGP